MDKLQFDKAKQMNGFSNGNFERFFYFIMLVTHLFLLNWLKYFNYYWIENCLSILNGLNLHKHHFRTRKRLL